MQTIYESHVFADNFQEYALYGDTIFGYPFKHRLKMFNDYWVLYFDSYGDYFPERGRQYREKFDCHVKKIVIQYCEVEILKNQFENKDILAISQRAAGGDFK